MLSITPMISLILRLDALISPIVATTWPTTASPFSAAALVEPAS
ncbi:Uncharacterised protein [Burkholderia pseudomallei]|nr:Uncharacterised protein [Burkholderia pseudomallei]CAJ3302948.1 Uncharacterised protein [Burkholderia pseudomallei]CAJ3310215.1 Uncharacterised protein [Burkholderia pseudomallei]CAJ3319693.1 Uncharacterised protein [Burkholderia pseudomallei]CAJ3320054.1 Uncharacterised protein [Burkholderia pseudomallei]